MCECGIIGEFLIDTCGNCVKPALGLGDLLAQGVDPCSVVLTLGFESASSNALSWSRQAAARSWLSRTREAKAPAPDAKRVLICWTAAAAED